MPSLLIEPTNSMMKLDPIVFLTLALLAFRRKDLAWCTLCTVDL